ncbi:hypothetical protein PAPYR_7902 [Paratrimastix pyriformis]|uniref:Uncharacterized protein n=1 Tax=Paratrimastix pyriformis TaxID=342808 RepID=A0ABQ8UBW4_9EUKA|nr:hypothetical protein PAPYR_7902 [Paratrimastix pyriformis]
MHVVEPTPVKDECPLPVHASNPTRGNRNLPGRCGLGQHSPGWTKVQLTEWSVRADVGCHWIGHNLAGHEEGCPYVQLHALLEVRVSMRMIGVMIG